MRILHVADRLPGTGRSLHLDARHPRGARPAPRADARRGRARAGDGSSLGLPRARGVVVRAGLESRTPAPVELDDVVAQVRAGRGPPPQRHEPGRRSSGRPRGCAAACSPSRTTATSARRAASGRSRATCAGGRCRARSCASCFEDQAYFDEVLGLTERRLAAVRRLQVSVLSRYMREELAAVGVPAESVHVVPPFVHDLDFQARADGPPCVLFVGRLAEAKGVREAVKAWRRSGCRLPLVVGGTGPLRAELEAEAAQREGPARSRCSAGSSATGCRRSTAARRPSSFPHAGRSRSGSWGSRRCASACRSWRGSRAASGNGTRAPASCAGAT